MPKKHKGPTDPDPPTLEKYTAPVIFIKIKIKIS
jgi:hypothetical protein